MSAGSARTLASSLRLLEQQEQAGGDQLGRRLVAGHEQLLDHVQQLGHGERLALGTGVAVSRVEAGVHQVGEQVVAALGPALFDARHHVALHLDAAAGALDLALLGQQPRQRRHRVVAPALERGHVGAVDAEGIGDHRQRERARRTGVTSLDLAVVDEAVDQLLGDAADVALHLPDPLGRERLVDEVAEPGVRGRVVGEQGRHARVGVVQDLGHLGVGSAAKGRASATRSARGRARRLSTSS